MMTPPGFSSDDRHARSEVVPKRFRDFVFVRELSEVYLLIDHISGRWDKNFADDGLIRQVCEIGWPPSGSDTQQAEQAAALIRMKDKLNGAARPANGMTVAFTLLVAGEANVERGERAPLRAWGRRLRRDKNPARPSDPDGGIPPALLPFEQDEVGEPPSRLSLARLAFPGLVRPALWFKWAKGFIIVLLLTWLGTTCVLSWDIAAGHAIYVRVEALRAQASQFEAKIKALEADSTRRGGAADGGGQAASLGTAMIKNCGMERLTSATPTIDASPTGSGNFDEIVLCNQIARMRLDYAVSRQNLAGWLGFWQRHLTLLSAWACRGGCVSGSPDAALLPDSVTNEQWGAILLEVLAGSVLPLCYGVLGAGAAVVRDLWAKMRESLLSPRDLTLALGQLALGAVIGACVGLFVSPASAPPQGSTGLVGSIVLSASALSFIAGFGVEAVFVALEGLIKRIFNLPQPARS